MTEMSVKSLKEMDSKLNFKVDDIKTEHEKCENFIKRQIDNNFENQKNISMTLHKRLENIQNTIENVSKFFKESENNSDSRLQALENNVTAISIEMDSKLNTTADDIMESMKTNHENVENSRKESQKNISMSLQNPVEQIQNYIKEPEPESKSIEIPSQLINCAEILKNKQSPNGVYQLYVPGFSSFDAYCMRDRENEDSPAWTVIQRRQNGEVNFTRNWTEYKNGFGNWKNDFWLGLDRMHALTSQKHYELLIDLEYGGREKYFVKYDKFAISNEEDGYRLKLGEFSGDVDDQFSYQHNSQFSTWDVDNDLHSSINCAKDYSGGWWYSHNCGWTNLNGEYEFNQDGTSIYWSQDLYNLMYARMAIRPNDIN